ncbi:MAG: hypothetical protein ABIG42_00190 [bacterium]
MGGYGSTRWVYHRKKRLVEECLQLDILKLNKQVLISDSHSSGLSAWTNDNDETIASINYEIFPQYGSSYVVRFDYTVEMKGESHKLQYDSKVVSSRLFSGGKRWWFICPLIVNGRKCEHRVRKLYLPPGEIYFGCRHCHRLTYRSAQEHDKRIDELLSLSGIELINRMSNFHDKDFGLYLKTLRKKGY